MKILAKIILLLFIFIWVKFVWSYTDLTPEEVHSRLVTGDTMLVLDVREISEYIAGHMAEPPGNLPLTPANLPLNSGVLEQQYSLLPRDIDIIVYCRSGGRSAAASSFLEGNGFTRIYNMTGGFSSWTYESRIGVYGDHSGHWIRASDPSPIMVSYVNNSDTSKIIFPTSALPEGIDSVYVEVHLAPVTAHIPPQTPTTDIGNVYRITALDRFGLDIFDADSLSIQDTVSIYLSLSTEAKSVLNPEMYIFVPGDGWTPETVQFDQMIFYNTDTVMRKWYYLGAGFDPTSLGNNSTGNVPEKVVLHQNYPNPFNPNTIINYELPIKNYVELSINNILGQKIVTLVSEVQDAGHHQVKWSASGFAGGVYFYKIKAGRYQDVKKMILIK